PHDHVLVANVVDMADETGGHKAADTALWREHVHAATMVGRVASAAVAVELGYAIRPDDGPSGRLGHWAIDGIPEEALDVHSKRAVQITAAVAAKGYDTYQARQVAARDTRRAKAYRPVADLVWHWQGELADAGYPVDELLSSVQRAGAERALRPERLEQKEMSALVAEVLAPDGPLATRKVFSRKDVVVAVAPALYGAQPTELDRVVDTVLADAETIPLLHVAGAKERAYACASVIAVEAAIAERVAAQAGRSDAAAVAFPVLDRAMSEAQAGLGGRALTMGQSDAVIAMCTSGRGLDLVVGVAGSGKTTTLNVARAAFEAAGYEVVGTSTSGQAARTLARQAGIAQSRTLASLLWRLDHGRLSLSARSVVILDEAAMTDDADLLGLLVAAEAAGAKVVMVGDDRQLGSVGPGGALGALLERHADAVHVLDENVRQSDPEERAALGELRSGEVDAAVAWYEARGRLVACPTRDQALDTVVAAWAADVDAGADAAMLAWRRANVAELNARGREVMSARGYLGEDEVVVGQRRYATGDWIVTLAPGAEGQLVTSEQGQVIAVDPRDQSLMARMDDGRTQRFGPDELAPDRLAHGYALTVHRSQGATLDTAHRFEDGGGRELAYVGMSRARERSVAYVVADDVEQATEDLVREWSAERRQRWAIDSGTPATTPLAVERDEAAPAELRTSLKRARLSAERQAVAAAIPADPSFELIRVKVELAAARRDGEELQAGRGRHQRSEVGRAVRALLAARAYRSQAESYAASPGSGWRERRAYRRQAEAWAEREAEASARFERLGGLERDRLAAEVDRLEERRDELAAAKAEREDWLGAHPEAARRLDRLDAELAALDPQLPDPSVELTAGFDLRTIDLGIRPAPGLDHGPELGPDLGVDFGIDL
ncbi:MAG: AAA family ATPase, partial [Actinomycetota bacterium]|nr:AAA family ATPase [Actinomycetota bacterium]